MRLDVCIFCGIVITPASLALTRLWGHLTGEPDMAGKTTSKRRNCPLYCTIDHSFDATQHVHHIAEVYVPRGHVAVNVNLVRGDGADEIELSAGRDGLEPAITHMTANEARTLRDALNVAVALLDRT